MREYNTYLHSVSLYLQSPVFTRVILTDIYAGVSNGSKMANFRCNHRCVTRIFTPLTTYLVILKINWLSYFLEYVIFRWDTELDNIK